MSGDILSQRALGRATLARQLLLRRSPMSANDAVAHLVGMQAQVPLNPYVGLWSRLQGFEPAHLAQLLVDRRVVRIVVMRATLHLVTSDDCLTLRPLTQPVLDGELARHPQYGPALRGVDIEEVLALARARLADRPHTGGQLRTALKERFPEQDAAALAYACRCLLALVQVPPRGVWGRTAQVASTTAESWLGRPLATDLSIDDVVLRYFAAFGPATVADVAAWSRLSGFRQVVDRLRPRLRTFRDERGRELLDVPDGPRPHPDSPAPPRFLPEYDNVLLSHADRSRFVSDKVSDQQRRRLLAAPGPVHGAVLSDGAFLGTWWIDRDKVTGGVTLVIRHVERLTKKATSALEAEGRRLLRLVEAEATSGDVRLVDVN